MGAEKVEKPIDVHKDTKVVDKGGRENSNLGAHVYKETLAGSGAAEAPSSSGDQVNFVDMDSPPHKRQKLDASTDHQQGGEDAELPEASAKRGHRVLEGPVKGRSDLGKALATMIKGVAIDGPSRKVLGLDRPSENKD